MLVEVFPSGPLSTNTYIAACPRTHKAVIIDSAYGSTDAVQAFVQKKKLSVEAILLTHSHWDHTIELPEMLKIYPVPVWIHREDSPNLEKPGSDGLPMIMRVAPIKPSGFLEEGQIFPVGQCSFEVIHTPGHSPGCVCFYNAEAGVLISGDTLFKGSLGNISFPTSDPKRMWTSLAKLARLPAQTRVFPGHGDPTTIGSEGWLSDAQRIFG